MMALHGSRQVDGDDGAPVYMLLWVAALTTQNRARPPSEEACEWLEAVRRATMAR